MTMTNVIIRLRIVAQSARINVYKLFQQNRGMVDRMRKLVDKLIIFIVCLAIYIPDANHIYMIVPILVATALSALFSYLEDERITLSLYIVYLIFSLLETNLLFFIPLISYDIFCSKFKLMWPFAFMPLISGYTQEPSGPKLAAAALIASSFILKYRTVKLQSTEKDYYKLRDDAKEISIQLSKQNKELLEKQDYEINLATLKERNRIARDIHDNVGHLLSRSILQIGALLAVNKDVKMEENLRLIKDTLSEAMDSVRTNVHNLHEESIDLQVEIQKLIGNINFCSIKFEYYIETNLEKDIKYCFIAVIKEALSNIAKHSNATNALISVREHPALYQLIIQDNGTGVRYTSENGMGVKNMTERVVSLGGNVNINTDKGFRIFISVPK